MRIEGTDEVPLVTDQPVEIIPTVHRPKPQMETLFPDESKKESPKASPPRPVRPYRAKYSDTTDRSVQALKSGLEPELPITSNPDADIDAVFGPPIDR